MPGDFSRWWKRSLPDRCGSTRGQVEKRFSAFAAAAVEPRSNVRPATSARIASYLSVQIVPTFGEVALGKITRLSVQSWIDSMSQALGARTVGDAYRVFAGFMREAVRQGLIRESPCYSIALPRVARPEPRFLSPDQVERLAEAIGPRYEPLIYTGAYLGPRWSELAGLKRSNLDLTGRRIRVIGALERVGNGWRYSEQMKTMHSRRTLSIPRFIADLVAEHMRTAPESEFVSPHLAEASSITATSEDAFGTRRWLRLASSGSLLTRSGTPASR